MPFFLYPNQSPIFKYGKSNKNVKLSVVKLAKNKKSEKYSGPFFLAYT